MTAAGTRRPRESCRFCDLGHRGHREGCPQVEIDAVTARALAAEAELADAEARGRAHGLLAAAWRIGSVADGIEGTTVDPAAQRAMREAERLIVALATEATDAD